MLELNNSSWINVKEFLYPMAIVDMSTYNEKTNECRVDFIDEFSNYSIKGKLLITDDETLIEIDNNEKLYLNNF